MRYTYIVLRHQPSLDSPTEDNFAVVVEGKAANGWVVFAVGRLPAPTGRSSALGVAIARRFPDVLTGVLSEAAKTKGIHESVLDRAQQLMGWNFHATRPQNLEDEDSIDRVGFKLFSQYVARADDLVTRASASSGPLQATHSGRTFEAVVPVPEPHSRLFVGA